MNSLPQIPVSFGCHPKTPPILNSPALLARFFIVVIICGIFPRAPASDSFHFTGLTEESLALFEGDRPVFVYNHGMIHQPGVPADRARSTYVHPLYGLDGEVLTDDFPADHTHHRGLFWAWPHVRVGECGFR